MASRPPNQASGSGSTNKPKKTKVKAPAKAPAKAAPTTPLYSWNGGAKTHTVSQSDHEMHVADPLTRDPIYGSAKQQATAYFAPQVNALNTLATNTPSYFNNYIAQARASAAASSAYAQPLIQQQQQYAANVNKPAAGLDPSSPEYQRSQQAGQGISSLAQFGANNTQANEAANQNYFQGQAATAAGALPGVLAGLATQQGQLGSQVAGRTQELYQSAKQAAVNEDIARQTLLGNQANMAADNSQAAADAAQAAKDKKAARVVSRKNTTDRITATTNTQANAQAKADAKQAEKDAAAQQKKSATIQKSIGKAKNKVQDIKDAWATGGTVEYTVQQKDPKTGKVKNVKKTRPVTRDELRGSLQQKYGTQWVSIMERVRAGQAITQAQIDYLHNQDPNFRVPAEWKNGKKKNAGGGTGNPAGAPYNGLG